MDRPNLGPQAMHPYLKLCCSLLAAFVLWLPSLQATLDGELDLLVGAIRFAIAFVIAQVAIGGFAALWHSYRVAGLADLEPSREPAS